MNQALAYAHGVADVPLRGETVGRMFDDVAAAHVDAYALVSRHQDVRWSYTQLHEQVERCARALIAAGVEPGDRVGIWSPNNAEWVVMQFATAKAGVILVNVNPSYRSHELEYALRQSGCSLLVLAAAFKDADYTELLAEVDAPELRRAVVLGEGWDAFLAAGDDVSVSLYARARRRSTSTTRSTSSAVEAERCTSLYGVPTMFIAELDEPTFADYDLSSLRTGIMAGSPCPVEVMKRVRDEMHMGEVTICYGMTETSPVSAQTGRGDPLEKQVGTVGRVHPHVEVKIVDPETGRTLPRNEPGELCTRGYSVMLGYWDNEEATREAIDPAGWMHTGDLASMDDDGYVNIVGRIKDMIIRGGENIYPREIEEFLYTHPAIADVQVIGVPDARYGEAVCAWVVLKPGGGLEEDELREFCRGKIARYKIPRYVRFVDEFPMTITGKIQKYRMREIEIAERGLAAAAATRTA